MSQTSTCALAGQGDSFLATFVFSRIGRCVAGVAAFVLVSTVGATASANAADAGTVNISGTVYAEAADGSIAPAPGAYVKFGQLPEDADAIGGVYWNGGGVSTDQSGHWTRSVGVDYVPTQVIAAYMPGWDQTYWGGATAGRCVIGDIWGDPSDRPQSFGAVPDEGQSFDIVLPHPGANISGTATYGDGSAPAGIKVSANATCGEVAEAEAGADGSYALHVPPGHSYTVSFTDPRSAPLPTQWYPEATSAAAATPVSPEGREVLSGIDGYLGEKVIDKGGVEVTGATVSATATTLSVGFTAEGRASVEDEKVALVLDGAVIETITLPAGPAAYARSLAVTGPRTSAVSLVTSWTYKGTPYSETAWAASVTIPAAPPVTPTTTRVAGANRYEASVNVSKNAYPSGAPVAYVVTGANYPDALSAGPAAAAEGGPLLLTSSAALLPEVEAEIRRLKPTKIVVVGGPNSISPAVFNALEAVQKNIKRVSGADRYEASRNLADYAFGSSKATTAYIATGANFPDALSAGAAASSANGPVVLVRGAENSVDAETMSLLNRLTVSRVKIAGGPNSVSPGVEASLKATGKNVARFGGADRYAASAAINADAFRNSTSAFLVTGLNFPDALSGSAWAGSVGSPLYVSKQDCVPAATLAAMKAQGVKHVTLIGGTNSLSPNVAALTGC